MVDIRGIGAGHSVSRTHVDLSLSHEVLNLVDIPITSLTLFFPRSFEKLLKIRGPLVIYASNKPRETNRFELPVVKRKLSLMIRFIRLFRLSLKIENAQSEISSKKIFKNNI